MANVWYTHIKIMNKSAKNREKILKELHGILDPDDYHGFANENVLFYQTKWEFHNIMPDLKEFSLEHPDVIFHIDTSGDVHNSRGYPESQKLFDRYYNHEYIQKGKIFKRKEVLFQKVLGLLPVADVRALAKSWEIKKHDGKKSEVLNLLRLHCWRNQWHIRYSWRFWDSLSKKQLKHLAGKYKLALRGSKEDLIARLSMTIRLKADDNHDMSWYANHNESSGVIGYQIVASGIRVQFEDGKIYLYSNKKPGKKIVEEMKEQAQSGCDLNTYINKHVRSNYENREL